VVVELLLRCFPPCRHHVHMNATKWLTLTDFVKFLGKEGYCRVDETPKGWFISLIQKDPAEELQDEKRSKRDRCARAAPPHSGWRPPPFMPCSWASLSPGSLPVADSSWP
jgi:Domain of Kin17 curved DNA-binding protein